MLICTAVTRDGTFTQELLHKEHIPSKVCENILEACREISNGCGALVIARETLTSDSVEALRQALDKEPPWSHIAVLVLASQGEVANAEASVTRLLGPFRNVTLLERPVRIVTFLGVLRSTLADRQRQYETRDLLEQLKRSNAALQDFASIASHDLKEPLRMVTAYLQLIAKQYRGKVLDETAEEYIRFAVSGASRMRGLIEGLLSYARLNTRSAPFVPLSCHEVLDEALSNLEVAIQESHATFEVGPLPVISGDRLQLVQLFQNLIANAIKFRAKPAPHIVVSSRDEDTHWVVSVKDNGIGFSPEHARKIFGMFQRLHSGDEYLGAGIGLAVCSTSVERHGAKIWAEAEAGKGATFFLAFAKSAEATPATYERGQSLGPRS